MKTKKQQIMKTNFKLSIIAFILAIIALLFSITSCSKEENQPTPITPIEQTPTNQDTTSNNNLDTAEHHKVSFKYSNITSWNNPTLNFHVLSSNDSVYIWPWYDYGSYIITPTFYISKGGGVNVYFNSSVPEYNKLEVFVEDTLYETVFNTLQGNTYLNIEYEYNRPQ